MDGGQDVTDSVFYREFGAIMMEAPVIGLEFTRYLPVVIVPYALLQARACSSQPPSPLIHRARRRVDPRRLNLPFVPSLTSGRIEHRTSRPNAIVHDS